MNAMLRDLGSVGMGIVDAVTSSQTGDGLAAVNLPASNGIDSQSWQDHYESVAVVGKAVVDLDTANAAVGVTLTISASANSDMSSATTIKTVSQYVVSADGELRVYDLNSNGVLHSLWFQGATALAMSSTGEELAVGDYNGRVALIDTATGVRRWHANPLGRHRWPWTLPAGFVLVWIYVAWRLFRRQRIVDGAHAETGVAE